MRSSQIFVKKLALNPHAIDHPPRFYTQDLA